MCIDPVTATIIATTSAAASTAMGAVSALQQASSQAKVQERNADLARASARDALDRGRQEAIQLGRAQSRMQGQQAVAAGASGLDGGFGSLLKIAGDTGVIQAEDRRTLSENFFRDMRGYDIEATNFGNAARAARAQGKAALIGGLMDVGTTAASGATQIRLYQQRRRGIFDYGGARAGFGF